MSLPWSKQSTLAITSHGVAFTDSKGKSQLLTESKFQWANVAQFAELLNANQALLKHQHVQVLLSNTLVRYLVLPWQNEVCARKDWLAIAQYEFRKQFGSAVDGWKVSVSFSGYGQTILAAAMDKSLYEQLEESAKTLNFTVTSIQPLLMTALNLTPQQHSVWTLVAEPQRIVLCRTYGKEWQQIVVDSPPAGFESQHAEQLIHRNLLQVQSSEQPSKVASYVSAALHQLWEHSNNTRQKLMLKPTGVQAHAVWMAGLPTHSQTKKVNLDFAEKSYINTNMWAWCLLMAALLAVGFLYTQYQHTTEKIKQAEAKVQLSTLAKPNLSVVPELEDKIKLAQQTQHQLNLPWMQMLAALETVKAANPHIALLNISPNKSRAEIKITGETAQFSDITHFLDDLRTNASFTDAVLVSQHLEDDQSKLLYVFEISLGWHI